MRDGVFELISRCSALVSNVMSVRQLLPELTRIVGGVSPMGLDLGAKARQRECPSHMIAANSL